MLHQLLLDRQAIAGRELARQDARLKVRANAFVEGLSHPESVSSTVR